jgi:hypothetical protein
MGKGLDLLVPAAWISHLELPISAGQDSRRQAMRLTRCRAQPGPSFRHATPDRIGPPEPLSSSGASSARKWLDSG